MNFKYFDLKQQTSFFVVVAMVTRDNVKEDGHKHLKVAFIAYSVLSRFMATLSCNKAHNDLM